MYLTWREAFAAAARMVGYSLPLAAIVGAIAGSGRVFLASLIGSVVLLFLAKGFERTE